MGATECESLEFDIDVTVTSPASFFSLADSKKPKDMKKNIKGYSVSGTVAGSDGEDKAFKYENFSYSVDGTSYATRGDIAAALGGKVTFKDCKLTMECAHRPWGYGGGGGGGGNDGVSAAAAGGDAAVEEKVEEEEEEYEEEEDEPEEEAKTC